MLTSFHIKALVAQLDSEINGSKITGTEFYKKERTACFFFKGTSRTVLVFGYHPTKFGIYHVPASKIKFDTREKPWPIFDLVGATVKSVEQVDFDRIFKIEVEKDKQIQTLVFEAIGVNGNIWLLNHDENKLATLRNRKFKPNETYSIAPVEGKLDPMRLNLASLLEKLHESKNLPLVYFIERNIIGCNLTIAKEIVKRSDIDIDESDEIAEKEAERIIKTLGQIDYLFENQQKGYLYQVSGKFEAYPFKLSSVASQPESFKTLSLAIMAMVEKKQDILEFDDREKTVREILKKSLKKLDRRYRKIETDLKDAVDFERYKKEGEILQINFDKLKKGLDQIELEDIYSDTGELINIKLDPASTPNENVDFYFKKYRKLKEGLSLLERRREITQSEIDELKIMIDEFDNNFEAAEKKYESELAALTPGEATGKAQAVRLPYKEYYLSSGLKIIVGRDGSDNDRTTFEFTKPYELWFHAQQCPGSHVAIKFPNKSFEPSKIEIEETAAVAAFFSKAKNDSLVPVVYTQRKYVRKPRNAKPGLVTVEREKSVMVEPKKPEENNLT